MRDEEYRRWERPDGARLTLSVKGRVKYTGPIGGIGQLDPGLVRDLLSVPFRDRIRMLDTYATERGYRRVKK